MVDLDGPKSYFQALFCSFFHSIYSFGAERAVDAANFFDDIKCQDVHNKSAMAHS